MALSVAFLHLQMKEHGSTIPAHCCSHPVPRQSTACRRRHCRSGTLSPLPNSLSLITIHLPMSADLSLLSELLRGRCSRKTCHPLARWVALSFRSG